jgi:uncharacterized membrane protein (DUF485 family)
MKHPGPPEDPTPVSGGWTDVTPLSHAEPKPPHERTAEEEAGMVDWEGIAASPAFKELLRRKAALVVPATIFFVLYYFALPVLVGWFPEWMNRRVLGPLNLAYLFALSQFFMAWTLAAIYLRVAGRLDVVSNRIASEAIATAEARR